MNGKISERNDRCLSRMKLIYTRRCRRNRIIMSPIIETSLIRDHELWYMWKLWFPLLSSLKRLMFHERWRICPMLKGNQARPIVWDGPIGWMHGCINKFSRWLLTYDLLLRENCRWLSETNEMRLQPPQESQNRNVPAGMIDSFC